MNDDLDLLTELYLDHSASPAQRERLVEMLRSDLAARTHFLASMATVLALRDFSQASGPVCEMAEPAKVCIWQKAHLLPLAAAACIAIMAVLFFWPAKEIAQLAVSGPGVEVERNKEVFPVTRTTSLKVGDQVRSSSQAGGVILFGDSTRIELVANSSLTLLDNRKGKRLWLERGTIQAKVAKQPVGQPLVFETKTAITEVIGTAFQLHAGERSTRLNVTEGIVRFQRRSDQTETLVSKGHQAIATSTRVGAMAVTTVNSASFQEKFDDDTLDSRGWYDGVNPAFSEKEHVKGSRRAVEFRFPNGSTKPAGGGIVLRRMMPASEAVCVSYWIKRKSSGDNAFSGSDVKIITNKDGAWVGPGCTHLTITIGTNEDCPAVWIQDGLNLDQSRLGQNLVGITEFRAVAGGNGDSDGYGHGVTYLREDSDSNLHSNWKGFTAESPLFNAAKDPLAKDGWQYVVVYIKLNSIKNGKGMPDGELRYWCNGLLALNYDKIVFRTAANEDMKLNQLLIAPSLHNSPVVDQSLWLDDLTVTAGVLPVDWEPHFPAEE